LVYIFNILHISVNIKEIKKISTEFDYQSYQQEEILIKLVTY